MNRYLAIRWSSMNRPYFQLLFLFRIRTTSSPFPTQCWTHYHRKPVSWVWMPMCTITSNAALSSTVRSDTNSFSGNGIASFQKIRFTQRQAIQWRNHLPKTETERSLASVCVLSIALLVLHLSTSNLNFIYDLHWGRCFYNPLRKCNEGSWSACISMWYVECIWYCAIPYCIEESLTTMEFG